MHIGKENEVTTNYMHIEPLVLPTQLPSDSEDSDGEPGMNEDCIYKEDFISKKLWFLYKRKRYCAYMVMKHRWSQMLWRESSKRLDNLYHSVSHTLSVF